jgi:hypothetical protein
VLESEDVLDSNMLTSLLQKRSGSSAWIQKFSSNMLRVEWCVSQRRHPNVGSLSSTLQFAGFNYEPHDLEYDPSTNDLAASIDETIAGEADLKENELKYAIGGRTVEGYEEPWEESELSTFKGEAADADSPRSRALWRMAINAVLAQVKERLHRRTWAAMQERRDRRLEYIELKYKYYVYCDFVNTIYDSSASTFLVTLADEEYARINELTDKFTQRDYDFYESLVEIKFRRTMRHKYVLPRD